MSDTNESKVVFKESFKGFNKEDVIKFIEKQAEDHEKAINESELRIERMNRQCIESTDKITALSARIAQLEETIAGEGFEGEASNGDAVKRLQDRIDELEAQLNSQQESDEPKSAETVYEEISQKMGKMIFSAEQTAKEIVDSANAKSEATINEAEQIANALIDDANNSLAEKTESNRQRLEDYRAVLAKFEENSIIYNKNAKEAFKEALDSLNRYEMEMKALFRLSEDGKKNGSM